jgi:hypothetical protein
MSALTLDIGYRLIPQPEAEWSDQLTQAQEMTWCLIQRLAIATEGTMPEKTVSRLLGLRDPRPFRSRVQHLVKKGALLTEKVS